MSPIILNYIAVGLFIQSLIVFVEVLINFKRPILLKIIILFIAVAFAWRGFGYVYCFHHGYNRWAIEMPQSLLPAGTISFFAYIYENRLKWYIISFGIFVFLLHLSFQAYFTFIVPVDPSIPLYNLPDIGNVLKLLKVFLTVSTFAVSLFILFKILTKYKSNNIYFVQIRKWTLYLILIQLFSGLSFVIYHYSNSQLNSIAYLFILVFNFLGVLLFSFRPKYLNRSNLKITLGSIFEKKDEDGLAEDVFVEKFFTNLFYLNKDASIETLLKLLNVSSKTLNNFLLTKYGSGLIDLVNKNRINYFIDLVNSGKYRNYTIDALAQKAGFSSRFHLYKSFRKFHGGTPSDFIRSVYE